MKKGADLVDVVAQQKNLPATPKSKPTIDALIGKPSADGLSKGDRVDLRGFWRLRGA